MSVLKSINPATEELFAEFKEIDLSRIEQIIIKSSDSQQNWVDIDIEKGLCDSSAAQMVNDDWAYCREMNVTGVPAFRFGERWLHGCQGVPALESLIRVERGE